MKTKETIFVCQNCGNESSKWMGKCPSCNGWDTFEETVEVKPQSKHFMKLEVKKVKDITKIQKERISSGFVEFDRVLGFHGAEQNCGFVEGQVILLSGEPGIGKSTILLQTISNSVSRGIESIYVSGEESISQIAIRAERILKKTFFEEIKIMNGNCVESIIETFDELNPKFAIVDSIQTVYSNDSRSFPGSVAQVRICASKLINYAKQNSITLIIVGHINKEGNIAGPKVLEHLVDSVFQLEGDEKSEIRMLRSLKNRFGPTMEVGLFQMGERGLVDMSDPSKLFGGEGEGTVVGVCRSIIIEGMRPMVVEVQALVSASPFAFPKRIAEGVALPRVQRIAAIISKYTKVDFSDKDIYLKIAGGMRVEDPSIDFAIAVAIISSAKKIAIQNSLVAIGELNLTGSVSVAQRINDRIKEARRLGYNKILDNSSISNISKLATYKF